MYVWKEPVPGCAEWFMLGRLDSNMVIRYLLTALLTWSPGETVCPHMAALSHREEFRGRQRSCAQSTFGSTVDLAVSCEVKG